MEEIIIFLIPLGTGHLGAKYGSPIMCFKLL